MLTTYLCNKPYSKFVLIEDTVDEPGADLLEYILQHHSQKDAYEIHYFVFEGNFEQKGMTTSSLGNIVCHNYVALFKDWLGDSMAGHGFPEILASFNAVNRIVIIDSLAHLVHEYGVAVVYRCLRQLMDSRRGLARLVALLHQDFFDNSHQVCTYFEHLSPLVVAVEPKFRSDKSRVSFIYTKSSGKVIKRVEEYTYENGILRSEPVQLIDPQLLVQESMKQVEPENLTTFRIGLDRKEKESRSKLVLPYLPKDSDEEEPVNEVKVGSGQIFYKFDDVDDWDEEDPDDDLDI